MASVPMVISRSSARTANYRQSTITDTPAYGTGAWERGISTSCLDRGDNRECLQGAGA